MKRILSKIFTKRSTLFVCCIVSGLFFNSALSGMPVPAHVLEPLVEVAETGLAVASTFAAKKFIDQQTGKSIPAGPHVVQVEPGVTIYNNSGVVGWDGKNTSIDGSHQTTLPSPVGDLGLSSNNVNNGVLPITTPASTINQTPAQTHADSTPKQHPVSQASANSNSNPCSSAEAHADVPSAQSNANGTSRQRSGVARAQATDSSSPASNVNTTNNNSSYKADPLPQRIQDRRQAEATKEQGNVEKLKAFMDTAGEGRISRNFREAAVVGSINKKNYLGTAKSTYSSYSQNIDNASAAIARSANELKKVGAWDTVQRLLRQAQDELSSAKDAISKTEKKCKNWKGPEDKGYQKLKAALKYAENADGLAKQIHEIVTDSRQRFNEQKRLEQKAEAERIQQEKIKQQQWDEDVKQIADEEKQQREKQAEAFKARQQQDEADAIKIAEYKKAASEAEAKGAAAVAAARQRRYLEKSKARMAALIKKEELKAAARKQNDSEASTKKRDAKPALKSKTAPLSVKPTADEKVAAAPVVMDATSSHPAAYDATKATSGPSITGSCTTDASVKEQIKTLRTADLMIASQKREVAYSTKQREAVHATMQDIKIRSTKIRPLSHKHDGTDNRTPQTTDVSTREQAKATGQADKTSSLSGQLMPQFEPTKPATQGEFLASVGSALESIAQTTATIGCRAAEATLHEFCHRIFTGPQQPVIPESVRQSLFPDSSPPGAWLIHDPMESIRNAWSQGPTPFSRASSAFPFASITPEDVFRAAAPSLPKKTFYSSTSQQSDDDAPSLNFSHNDNRERSTSPRLLKKKRVSTTDARTTKEPVISDDRKEKFDLKTEAQTLGLTGLPSDTAKDHMAFDGHSFTTFDGRRVSIDDLQNHAQQIDTQLHRLDGERCAHVKQAVTAINELRKQCFVNGDYAATDMLDCMDMNIIATKTVFSYVEEATGTSVTSTIKHPIETELALAEGTMYLMIEGMRAQTFLDHLEDGSVKPDELEFIQQQVQRFDELMNRAANMTWEEALEASVRLALEPVVWNTILGSEKIIEAITQAVKSLKAAAKADPAIKAALAPAAAIVKLTAENGAVATQQALKIIKANPELIAATGSISSTLAALRRLHNLSQKTQTQAQGTQQSTSGGNAPKDPKEPKDDEDKNKNDDHNRAKEFEKKISKMSPNERVATVKAEAKKIANDRGWEKTRKVPQINGQRTVYMDKNAKRLYSVDTQHGRFEVLDEDGIHLGEIDFDFNPTKGPDLSGGHNLKMP